jgi:hypothetical protein
MLDPEMIEDTAKIVNEAINKFRDVDQNIQYKLLGNEE